METKLLKKDLEALLGGYIGQKLRENDFDPKGQRSQTLLDDLAHYDLAITVALWWLERHKPTETDIITIHSCDDSQYPDHMERKAMILSSFAGIILNSLPVEEVLSLYRCRPSIAYKQQNTKNAIVHPFPLSYHPFAMLTAYKAVHHSWKHTRKLKLWRSSRSSAVSPTQRDTSVKAADPTLHSLSSE
ncbi:hypothetical protein GN956_G20926 [Arapaima gigas]